MTLNNGSFHFASIERCSAHHRVPCVSVAELLAFRFAFWFCFQNKLSSLQTIKRSTFQAKDRETNILSWFTWINKTFYVTPATFLGFDRNYCTNASIGFAPVCHAVQFVFVSFFDYRNFYPVRQTIFYYVMIRYRFFITLTGRKFNFMLSWKSGKKNDTTVMDIIAYFCSMSSRFHSFHYNLWWNEYLMCSPNKDAIFNMICIPFGFYQY